MRPQGYRLIPLRRRDGSIRAHAIVDAADFDWLNQWRWCAVQSGSRQYAFRYERRDGRYRPVRMHRLVLGLAAADPRDVDHINRDPLDNRRANLRAVTRGQNMQNQASHRGSSSRFRGVSFDKRSGRWAANARLNGKQHWLGYHDTEEAAAEAARAFRLAHMTHSEPDRSHG